MPNMRPQTRRIYSELLPHLQGMRAYQVTPFLVAIIGRLIDSAAVNIDNWETELPKIAAEARKEIVETGL